METDAASRMEQQECETDERYKSCQSDQEFEEESLLQPLHPCEGQATGTEEIVYPIEGAILYLGMEYHVLQLETPDHREKCDGTRKHSFFYNDLVRLAISSKRVTIELLRGARTDSIGYGEKHIRADRFARLWLEEGR